MNLSLQPVADTYTYFSCPNAVYVTIQVLAAAVDISFGQTVGSGGPETASYQPTDETLLPGTLVRPEQCDAIRFKNHTPGLATVAQIAISTRNLLEVPDRELGASFTPNYSVLNPDGSVGANFTGHVHAQGLDLDSGTNTTPPDTDRVRWINSLSRVVAALYAYTLSGGQTDANLVLEAISNSTADQAKVLLEALAGNQPSFLQIQSGPTAAASAILAILNLNIPGPQATLLDGAGKSSFVTLPALTNGTMSLNGGRVIFTWPGGQTGSSQLLINHGLGRVPISYGVLPDGQAANNTPFTSNSTNSPSNLQLAMQLVRADGVSPGAGGQFGATWFAIG